MAEDGVRVLAIDGGGIKGYLAARLLEHVRVEAFDLVVGTSTGGILALALGAGIPPAEIAQLYRNHGEDIFTARWLGLVRQLWRPKYRATGLRTALEEVFGDRRVGSVGEGRHVLVTTYDLIRGQSFLIKSWKEDRALIPMVDAAMATSAAPTYFPPHQIGGLELVDGGVFANSPGWIALTEARKLWPGRPVELVSIGFGDKPLGVKPGKSQGWGALQWVRRIAPVFMDSAADTVDYALRMELGDAYRRVAPERLDLAMDDAQMDAFRVMDAQVAGLAERLRLAVGLACWIAEPRKVDESHDTGWASSAVDGDSSMGRIGA